MLSPGGLCFLFFYFREGGRVICKKNIQNKIHIKLCCGKSLLLVKFFIFHSVYFIIWKWDEMRWFHFYSWHIWIPHHWYKSHHINSHIFLNDCNNTQIHTHLCASYTLMFLFDCELDNNKNETDRERVGVILFDTWYR